MEPKLYRCKGCGTEKVLSTNHYSGCYPGCVVCHSGMAIWECRELDFDIIIKRLEESDARPRL